MFLNSRWTFSVNSSREGKIYIYSNISLTIKPPSLGGNRGNESGQTQLSYIWTVTVTAGDAVHYPTAGLWGYRILSQTITTTCRSIWWGLNVTRLHLHIHTRLRLHICNALHRLLCVVYVYYCITKWRPMGNLYLGMPGNNAAKIGIAGAVPQKNSCLFVLVSC